MLYVCHTPAHAPAHANGFCYTLPIHTQVVFGIHLYTYKWSFDTPTYVQVVFGIHMHANGLWDTPRPTRTIWSLGYTYGPLCILNFCSDVVSSGEPGRGSFWCCPREVFWTYETWRCKFQHWMIKSWHLLPGLKYWHRTLKVLTNGHQTIPSGPF